MKSKADAFRALADTIETLERRELVVEDVSVELREGAELGVIGSVVGAFTGSTTHAPVFDLTVRPAGVGVEDVSDDEDDENEVSNS